MKKVQEIVRSMPWFTWTPGVSVCYNNVSYTRTARKRNFKFDWVKVGGPENKEDKESELLNALRNEGHKVSLVMVSHGFGVQVWMENEPIEITEKATA